MMTKYLSFVQYLEDYKYGKIIYLEDKKDGR